MSDSPTPQPDKQKRRPERPSNSNLILYVLVGLLLCVVLLSQFGDVGSESLNTSEFLNGIESGKFSQETVSDLTIGQSTVSFTYKSDETEDGKPVEKNYRVNITSFGDSGRVDLRKLLDENKVGYNDASDQSQWQMLIYTLLPFALFLVVILIMLRRFGGAGTAMSFGRSRGKLAAQEDVGITFSDVAGIDEAVNELKEIVEFLRTPQKYQALGGRIPRGVLLVGPPGTGKTLLAKAVAGEAGVPFFSLSGSDFVEMFVGVGAARVRDMFQQAVAKSPAIIFIDELDALGKTRGSGMPGGHDEREQTLNALLVEMDGFDSDQSVIVMGATNRPETLDPALLRPGRFDRNVTVDRPDKRGRLHILKVHAKKVKLADDVDLDRIALITPGFVGADLANLVNEAALLAARADKTEVTSVEFEEAVERVIAGLEKQGRVIHEEEKIRISYHECGHALVACSLPHTDPVHKISIIPRGMGLGYTLHFPEDERLLTTRTELIARICCFLGGIAAEEIVFEETSTGAQNDLQRASDIARRMVTEFGMSDKLGRVHYSETRTSFLGPQASGESIHAEETVREIDMEVKRIIDEANATALEVLTTRREVLDRLAKELLEIEVMDSDHLQRILNEYKGGSGPQLKPGTSAKAKTDPVDRSKAAGENPDVGPADGRGGIEIG
ncbi:ATP-dependent zinc metalloprotease FtsH [Stratiformator vulcanicus]|uniref:ATP-dependent zinc metalloprotease FtsH n=1 Tax=Stratiformator vulcanicus TaxID=2527980 RepID=A0A517R736_9PLAN|nr:ATP-dependent zinc metalloprotease FtsH [Stratiformator vulcanicus]QDT39662.1 ATP-dependent zinc metalloprotease FtsH 4 [Stratiformator vulcanicus]